MRCESTEVTDVVVSLCHADVKAGLAWNAEFFAGFGTQPISAALEFVLASTAHTFHDFRCAGVEGQGGGQNHAHRFFGAIGQRDVVADALAIEVDVGLGGHGNVVEFFGGHGEIKGRLSWPPEGWHEAVAQNPRF